MTDQTSPPPPEPNIAALKPVDIELEKGKSYFFCTCGLSQKLPNCDGAHKGTGLKSMSFSALVDGEAIVCVNDRSLKTQKD